MCVVPSSILGWAPLFLHLEMMCGSIANSDDLESLEIRVFSLLPSRRYKVEENWSNVIREMRNDRCVPYIDSMCVIKPWTCDKFSNS